MELATQTQLASMTVQLKSHILIIKSSTTYESELEMSCATTRIDRDPFIYMCPVTHMYVAACIQLLTQSQPRAVTHVQFVNDSHIDRDPSICLCPNPSAALMRHNPLTQSQRRAETNLQFVNASYIDHNPFIYMCSVYMCADPSAALMRPNPSALLPCYPGTHCSLQNRQ